MATPGILALPDLSSIMRRVREYEEFSRDNDPFGEHDFGALMIDGQHIFWKIDTYDLDYRYGSPDPSDPAVTARVITVMLASEY